MSMWKQFFLIDHKSFDVISEGREKEVICICESGRAFRVSITLVDKDVRWLIDAFAYFYWRKGRGRTWGKQFVGEDHNLFIQLRRNRFGRYLVLTDMRGKDKMNFYP